MVAGSAKYDIAYLDYMAINSCRTLTPPQIRSTQLMLVLCGNPDGRQVSAYFVKSRPTVTQPSGLAKSLIGLMANVWEGLRWTRNAPNQI
jgi:hypothetical protein